MLGSSISIFLCISNNKVRSEEEENKKAKREHQEVLTPLPV